MMRCGPQGGGPPLGYDPTSSRNRTMRRALCSDVYGSAVRPAPEASSASYSSEHTSSFLHAITYSTGDARLPIIPCNLSLFHPLVTDDAMRTASRWLCSGEQLAAIKKSKHATGCAF